MLSLRRPSEQEGPRWGLIAGMALVALAAALPALTHWAVHAIGSGPGTAAPLHATGRPTLGIGTPVAVALGIAGVVYSDRLALGLSWARLLFVTFAASLAWTLSLAYVYGPSGLSRELQNPSEYLDTARQVRDVPALLQGFVGRIPLSAAPDNWPTHVAGHPPGALLFFVTLVHLGLGSAYAAGLVVTVLGATTPVAVLLTLSSLGVTDTARRAAPFLVLTPAVLWMAVSGDGVFAAVAAWGLAALAAAGAVGSRPRRWLLGVVAGLLLGLLPLLSYGLVLVALIALAVLVTTRAWRIVPLVAIAALVPVTLFAHLGFNLWAAYPVVRERYYAGLAGERPAAYWLWGDLAALLMSAGPALGVGLGSTWASWHRVQRPVRYLVGAAVASIVLADASLMSKAEVERIWLPFIPWLLISTALLPERWRRPCLVLQVVTAVLIESLLDTRW